MIKVINLTPYPDGDFYSLYLASLWTASFKEAEPEDCKCHEPETYSNIRNLD
jgi:hypothetical protein